MLSYRRSGNKRPRSQSALRSAGSARSARSAGSAFLSGEPQGVSWDTRPRDVAASLSANFPASFLEGSYVGDPVYAEHAANYQPPGHAQPVQTSSSATGLSLLANTALGATGSNATRFTLGMNDSPSLSHGDQSALEALLANTALGAPGSNATRFTLGMNDLPSLSHGDQSALEGFASAFLHNAPEGQCAAAQGDCASPDGYNEPAGPQQNSQECRRRRRQTTPREQGVPSFLHSAMKNSLESRHDKVQDDLSSAVAAARDDLTHNSALRTFLQKDAAHVKAPQGMWVALLICFPLGNDVDAKGITSRLRNGLVVWLFSHLLKPMDHKALNEFLKCCPIWIRKTVQERTEASGGLFTVENCLSQFKKEFCKTRRTEKLVVTKGAIDFALSGAACVVYKGPQQPVECTLILLEQSEWVLALQDVDNIDIHILLKHETLERCIEPIYRLQNQTRSVDIRTCHTGTACTLTCEVTQDNVKVKFAIVHDPAQAECVSISFSDNSKLPVGLIKPLYKAACKLVKTLYNIET